MPIMLPVIFCILCAYQYTHATVAELYAYGLNTQFLP
jgi:hypothetical protein